jgi:glutathione S-transferase
MIKLLQFPRPPREWNVSNFSAFCMKVETYLKMAELPYEVVDVIDPRKMPKGKLPVIDDGGKIVPDSGFIIEHLKSAYGDKLDAKLSEHDRALGHSVRRMLEEHLYFILLYYRWEWEPGWSLTKDNFFKALPGPVRPLVRNLVRKSQVKKVEESGIGRHPQEDILKIGYADVECVSRLLEDRTFLFGQEPTSFDATLYAFLASLISVPVESPLKLKTLGLSNITAYVKRVRDRYFA